MSIRLVLGLVLFLVFINDLPDNIKSSSVHLFADDCALYRNINSPKDYQILQKDLDSTIACWETDWQMKFNIAKCQSVRVTKHLTDKQYRLDYSLHQQTLKEVQSDKYLVLRLQTVLL